MAAQPAAPLYLFEGERKADRGQEVIGDDGVALAWRGGCGQLRKSLPAIVEVARGREVVLVADCDREGRDAMQTIAASLHGLAQSVFLLDLYGDESKRDLEDWLHEGHTGEEFRALVAELEEYVPSSADDSTDSEPTRLGQRRVLLGQRMIDGVAPPDHLIENILLRGGVHTLAGEPESGKTIIALHFALRTMDAGLPVLFLDEESGPDMLTERLESMAADPAMLDALFHYVPFASLGITPRETAELMDYIAAIRPGLIILDSLADALQAANLDENDALDVTAFMKSWPVPASRIYGATVVLLDHMTKAQEHTGYARGSGAKKAKMDAVWLVVKSAEFT